MSEKSTCGTVSDVLRDFLRIAPWLVFALAILAEPCYPQTSPGQPLEDPNAVVRSMLSAIQNPELVRAGRGTATILAYTPFPDEGNVPGTVDFAFQGPRSRQDYFASAGGTKGARLCAWAVTEKCTYHLGSRAAWVIAADRPLHKSVGHDFHPEVFMTLHGMETEFMLKQMLLPIRKLSGVADSNGVIHLTSQYRSDDPNNRYTHTLRLSFDPGKGCHPVLLAMDTHFVDKTEKSGTQIMKVDWVKTGSGWYVSAADYKTHAIAAPEKGVHTQFKVTHFDPNAVVSDAEFTWEGLGVPEGMTISDHVTRRPGYRYALRPGASEPNQPPK